MRRIEWQGGAALGTRAGGDQRSAPGNLAHFAGKLTDAMVPAPKLELRGTDGRSRLLSGANISRPHPSMSLGVAPCAQGGIPIRSA